MKRHKAKKGTVINMSIRKFLPLLLCFCLLAGALPCGAAKPQTRDDLAGKTFLQTTMKCEVDPTDETAENYFAGNMPYIKFGDDGRGEFGFHDFETLDYVTEAVRYTVSGNVVEITSVDGGKDGGEKSFEIKMELRGDGTLVVTEMPTNGGKFHATVKGDIFKPQGKTEADENVDNSDGRETRVSGLSESYEITKGDSLTLTGKVTAPDGGLIVSVELKCDNPNFSKITRGFEKGVESFELSEFELPAAYPLNTAGTHEFELLIITENSDGTGNGIDELAVKFSVNVTAGETSADSESRPKPGKDDADDGADEDKKSGILTAVIIVAVISAAGLIGALAVMAGRRNKFSAVPSSAPAPAVPPMAAAVPRVITPVPGRSAYGAATTEGETDLPPIPEADRYCSKCGKKVILSDRMCKRCGLIFTKPSDTYVKEENGGTDRHGGGYFTKPPRI